MSNLQRRASLVVAVAVLLSGLAISIARLSPARATTTTASSLPPLASTAAPKASPQMPTGDFSDPPATASRPRTARPASFGPQQSQVIATSADKQTYKNSDGSKTEVISDGQARVPNGTGGWNDVDLTLESDGTGRYRPKASAVPTSIGASSNDSLADVDFDGTTLRLWVMNATPGVAGQTETGPQRSDEKLPHGGPNAIDVRTSALTHGVETTYSIPDAATATQTITERLDLPTGWTARQNGGAIDIVDNTGAVRGHWFGGAADDHAAVPAEREVTMVLDRVTNAQAYAHPVVDQAWLADTCPRVSDRRRPDLHQADDRPRFRGHLRRHWLLDTAVHLGGAPGRQLDAGPGGAHAAAVQHD